MSQEAEAVLLQLVRETDAPLFHAEAKLQQAQGRLASIQAERHGLQLALARLRRESGSGQAVSGPEPVAPPSVSDDKAEPSSPNFEVFEPRRPRGPASRYSDEERREIVTFAREHSIPAATKKFGVSYDSVRNWFATIPAPVGTDCCEDGCVRPLYADGRCKLHRDMALAKLESP